MAVLYWLAIGRVVGSEQVKDESEKMTHDEYVSEIIRLIHTVVETKLPISASTGIVDGIGMASIEIMELIDEIEDRFDISFPLNDLELITSIGEMAQTVAKLAEQQN